MSIRKLRSVYKQMKEKFQAGGFILTGGRSRRMGRDKALLEVDGQCLLLRAANLLKAYADPVILLGPRGRYEFCGLPVFPDREPGSGPLAALLTGLEDAAHDWNIFLACDLPMLSSQFIKLLLGCAQHGDFEAVVARTSRGWQPLCAAYRRTCVPKMRGALEEGKSALVDVLPGLRIHVITPERLAKRGLGENIFQNVNFPKDWRKVLNQSPNCAL